MVVMSDDNNTSKENMIISESQKKVLDILSKGFSQISGSAHLGVSQQYISKVAKNLESKGLIKIERIAVNLSNYLITTTGYEVLRNSPQAIAEKVVMNHPNIRIHALEIAIRIPPSMRVKWEQYLNRIFEIQDIRPVGLKNNEQGLMNIGNMRVKTTTRSVLFYPDDVYGIDTKDAEEKLIDVIIKSAEKINNTLGMKVYKRQWANIEITRQEIARLDDPIAKKYIDAGLRAKIRIGGDERIHIDFSKKVPELEAVHRRHAPEDMRKIETLYKDVITDKFNTEIVNADIDSLKEKANLNEDYFENLVKQNQIISDSQNKITKNMELLSKYLNQHIPFLMKSEAVMDRVIEKTFTESQKKHMIDRFIERGKQRSVFHFT